MDSPSSTGGLRFSSLGGPCRDSTPSTVLAGRADESVSSSAGLAPREEGPTRSGSLRSNSCSIGSGWRTIDREGGRGRAWSDGQRRRFARTVADKLDWLKKHPKWKWIELACLLRGQEQYDYVRKYRGKIEETAGRPRSSDPHPVMETIKAILPPRPWAPGRSPRVTWATRRWGTSAKSKRRPTSQIGRRLSRVQL